MKQQTFDKRREKLKCVININYLLEQRDDVTSATKQCMVFAKLWDLTYLLLNVLQISG